MSKLILKLSQFIFHKFERPVFLVVRPQQLIGQLLIEFMFL